MAPDYDQQTIQSVQEDLIDYEVPFRLSSHHVSGPVRPVDFGEVRCVNTDCLDQAIQPVRVGSMGYQGVFRLGFQSLIEDLVPPMRFAEVDREDQDHHQKVE